MLFGETRFTLYGGAFSNLIHPLRLRRFRTPSLAPGNATVLEDVYPRSPCTGELDPAAGRALRPLAHFQTSAEK